MRNFRALPESVELHPCAPAQGRDGKEDEGAQARRLSEHVLRIREKIDMLARKNYPKVFSAEHRDRNYLPVTAMFVGYEAPLLEALKAEPSLWKRAADNNVILA